MQEGARYQWRTLDITIINQQTQTGNGLYYNIRYKGQHTDNWTELYHAGTYISQQSGQYTSIPFLLSGSYPSTLLGALYKLPVPTDTSVAFQVQALIGTNTRGSTQFGSGDVFTGQTSDWSNTQTINIPSANSSPAPSPTVPELSWFALFPLCLFVLSVALVKRRKTLNGS